MAAGGRIKIFPKPVGPGHHIFPQAGLRFMDSHGYRPASRSAPMFQWKPLLVESVACLVNCTKDARDKRVRI